MYACNGNTYALFTHEEVARWTKAETEAIAAAAKALANAQDKFNAEFEAQRKPNDFRRRTSETLFNLHAIFFNAWSGWDWLISIK